MIVYIVLIEDRHSDPEVKVFSTSQKAIREAKKIAKVGSNHNSSEIEERIITGWLYYATYSCENDCVRVEEKVIDAD